VVWRFDGGWEDAFYWDALLFSGCVQVARCSSDEVIYHVINLI
jgi:hypothetical protein